MSRQETIAFAPKWYNVGDPEVPALAVVYGVVALASIWLLGTLAHQLFFLSRSDMSLSHVAAFVAFQGSTWKDIFVWLSWNLWPRWSGAKDGDSSKKMNRRALSAILLRSLVVRLEITLLFLTFPRTIPIFEDQVGSTQMNFVKNMTGSQTNLLTRDTPCKLDPVPYAGFTPSAVRQICIHAVVRKDLMKIPPEYPNGTEIYLLAHNKTRNQLRVGSLRSQSIFIMEHVIRIPSRGGQDLNLPLPDNIAEQAIGALLLNPKLRRVCSLISPLRLEASIYAAYCKPSSTESITTADELPDYLLRMASTTLTNATLRTAIAGHKRPRPVQANSRVGIIHRPRLCVYPALIVFAVLVVLNFIACKVLGDEDILFYLFRFSCEAMNAKFTGNPLLVESKTYPL